MNSYPWKTVHSSCMRSWGKNINTKGEAVGDLQSVVRQIPAWPAVLGRSMPLMLVGITASWFLSSKPPTCLCFLPVIMSSNTILPKQRKNSNALVVAWESKTVMNVCAYLSFFLIAPFFFFFNACMNEYYFCSIFQRWSYFRFKRWLNYLVISKDQREYLTSTCKNEVSLI